jgi:hypothetical protein
MNLIKERLFPITVVQPSNLSGEYGKPHREVFLILPLLILLSNLSKKEEKKK